MATYRVVVGNIGQTHEGPDLETARSVFNVYVEQSKNQEGRAAGESVVLFADGDIEREYEPRGNVLDFEVLDHGEDGSQYFPGCGVSFTRFAHVATGVGDTGNEALDNALEQMAMSEPEARPSALQEAEMRAYLNNPDKSAHEGIHTAEELADEDFDHDSCDWSRWVSIRYNIREEGS